MIRGARALIDEAVRQPGNEAVVRWLPQDRWQKHPIDEKTKAELPRNWNPIDWSHQQPTTYVYPYAGDEHGMAPTPFTSLMEAEGWMQRSRVNSNHFVIDFKKKAEIDRTRASGGTVHVDGYTQMRAGKPVDVSDHMRSAPQR